MHSGFFEDPMTEIELTDEQRRILQAEQGKPLDVVDPATGELLPDITPLLGRAGFRDEYAVAVDSGYLIRTPLGLVRRWWRRRLHALGEALRMVHPLDEPV
jgi:hypothetical protein